MKYDPKKHHRRSIRQKGYDYSREGLYFVTFCVKNRAPLFGHIECAGGPGGPGGPCRMVLNDAGKMVETEWLKLPSRFKNIKMHEFIVMPDHFHGILEIVGDGHIGATLVVAPLVVAPFGATTRDGGENGANINGATRDPPPNEESNIIGGEGKILGDMVGAFQSIVTVEYIRGVKNKQWQRFDGKLWQRNYWERIIRSEKARQTIAKYIQNNPNKWKGRKFYTDE